MKETIDTVYQDVISMTARVSDAFRRDDIQQRARIAYVNEQMGVLRRMKKQLEAFAPVYIKPTTYPHSAPAQKTLGSNMEASGMPNPRVYNYYTNFNSPKNNLVVKPAQSFPLYSNFGAYNKQNV